jgi:hypothetical protein
MIRDINIDISFDPPVSGYGGYDSFIIEDTDSKKNDDFMEDLEKLVEKYGGYFNGST